MISTSAQLPLAKNGGYETHGEGKEVRKQLCLSPVLGGAGGGSNVDHLVAYKFLQR